MPTHPRWLRQFLSDDEMQSIAGAVAGAETRTSAEVRVHLDAACPGDALVRAVEVFERLDMHRTALRNGVLIYVCPADRKVAVIGDRGIHERVGPAQWERVVAGLVSRFREARVREALLEAVAQVGEMLSTHFPRRPDDRDELSDEVSTSG